MMNNNVQSFVILQTDEGYMVQNRITGEYLEDSKGNNCFESISTAEDLLEAQFYAK